MIPVDQVELRLWLRLSNYALRVAYWAAALNPPVERRRHPPDCRMPDWPLHVGDDMTRIGLIPASVQLLGYGPKLDD